MKIYKKENIKIFMIKKFKNPFKMWGSWIGFDLYPVLIFLSMKLASSEENIFLWILSIPFIIFKPIIEFLVNLSDCSGLGCISVAIMLILIFSSIFGFLIGWGIELFFRKNKLFNLK